MVWWARPWRVSAPAASELQALVRRIGKRVGRHLERKEVLVRDAESSHLVLEPFVEDDGLAQLQAQIADLSRIVQGHIIKSS